MTESDRCCHAVQDKVWVDAPDVPLGGWEFYTVLADDPDQDTGDADSVLLRDGAAERQRRAAPARAEHRAMTAAAVLVEDVHVRFGDVRALDGIDLDVARGIDARRARPQRRRQDHPDPGAHHPDPARPPGGCSVDGFDVVADADQVRRRIGVTGQYAGLDEFLTGRENLELIGRLTGLGTARPPPGRRR